MPLLSTRIWPSLVLASATVVGPLGAGAAVVVSPTVVVVGFVFELAGLLLLEHAAKANAATAATATSRIPDVRMRASPGWTSPTTTGGAFIRFT